MQYEFPEIHHLDDVRAAIEGRDERYYDAVNEHHARPSSLLEDTGAPDAPSRTMLDRTT